MQRVITQLGLMLVLSVSVSGCLLESHVNDPMPLAGFCDGFFDALCEPIESCECGAAAVAICRGEQRAICAGFPSDALIAAVDEGRIVYDAAAATSLLARMEQRSITCEGFVSALDWRVGDLLDLGGVMRGRVEAGESCQTVGFELISECALGSCVPGVGGRFCRSSVSAGEACDRTHMCVDLGTALEIDSGIDRLVLRCVTAAGEDAGLCADWVGEGSACTADGECWTGRCDGEVCRAGGIGEACLSSRECASNYCRTADFTCQLGDALNGEGCDDHAACASHVCIAGTCLPPACGTF